LYVTNFEDTQSDKKFASGALSAKLAPGTYNYVLQLSMLQEINERSTQRREIQISSLENKTNGEIYLINSVTETSNGMEYMLMNMDDNITFGKDFTALIRIPEYKPGTTYTAIVQKTRENGNPDSLYNANISSEEILKNVSLSVSNRSEPALTLNSSGEYTYAAIKIPSSTFDNSSYKLTIKNSSKDSTVAERNFQTYWQEMPASLYNLNIAIDMMKFIISEDELNRIKQGSDKEKERKFRAFWDQRDPTPNTVYNELMAEYYSRIDHAYKEFGSQQEPLGHESDRGEVYIKFGPPNSKERVFPPGGKTREIWKYPNQSFVFEAVSGFGDFKLIGKQ